MSPATTYAWLRHVVTLSGKRTLCVVPCFNEERNLPTFIGQSQDSGVAAHCDLLFVDDGSSDASVFIMNAAHCRILTHGRNFGYGAAIKSGVRYCLEHGYENLAVMPADNQRTFEDLLALIRAIESDRYDVVIGSKLGNGQTIPRTRLLGNVFFSWLARWMWGATYKDVLSGFKVYKVQRLAPFFERLPDRYEYDLIFSRYSQLFSLSTIEIPVKVRYHRHSTSMKNSVLVGVRILLKAVTEHLAVR